VTAFAPLLELLAQVPDPRRGQGKMYKLPYVLLFAILAVVTGGNSYRSIVIFIDVNRRKLNDAFGLNWKRASAHTAVRYILQGLDTVQVEAVFRQPVPGCSRHVVNPVRAVSRWMAKHSAAASIILPIVPLHRFSAHSPPTPRWC
jgi:hypothetical protein